MKLISIFNNKGGVGKTTYMYHIANILSDRKINTLMVDCDSQCNLTAYSLRDNEIEKSWDERGNSIYRNIEPVDKGLGDIRSRSPYKINEHLYIVPGDINLSTFEDRLGDTWTSAPNQESAVRVQTAIYRYIKWAAAKVAAEVVLIDLGPNLGSLNRAVLGGSDYFIIPVSPDLFSIRGTANLGNKLVTWNTEWKQIYERWKNNFEVPAGTPSFAGYVTQQHNLRSNSSGMTQGWSIFGTRLEAAIEKNIVKKLEPLNQVIKWQDGNYNLGKIPNLHSLIPYSLEARKPVYRCGYADGLQGAHITRAKESEGLFYGMVGIVQQLIKS